MAASGNLLHTPESAILLLGMDEGFQSRRCERRACHVSPAALFMTTIKTPGKTLQDYLRSHKLQVFHVLIDNSLQDNM